ncbi:MAG TPA: PilZ domain-containing protein, partial [Rhodospirillales bacterium]|nr:PilZ domain-containing protein [Rhodospirillales bacterium]
MSSIHSEPNSRRRAHRVDLPMVVEIDGRALPARDWSVTGVAVEVPPGFEPKGDGVLSARLMIPMHGASLALRVKLRLVARDGEVARFAFVDLSPRDRRILRQYIELGIEGRLDNVEDMIALLAQPELPSP